MTESVEALGLGRDYLAEGAVLSERVAVLCFMARCQMQNLMMAIAS